MFKITLTVLSHLAQIKKNVRLISNLLDETMVRSCKTKLAVFSYGMVPFCTKWFFKYVSMWAQP